MGQAAVLCGGSWDQDPPTRARGLPLAPWVGTSLPHTAVLCKNNQAPLWFQKATFSGWSFTCTCSTSCRLRQAASLSSGHRGRAASFLLAALGLGRQGPQWLDASLPFRERSLPFPLQVASSFEHPQKPCLHGLRELQSLGGLNGQRVWPCCLVTGSLGEGHRRSQKVGSALLDPQLLFC